MVAKEPIARRAVASVERDGNLDERSTLIACLKWQVDCGHDGWTRDFAKDFAKDFERDKTTRGEVAGGWENADSVTRELLESITRQNPLQTPSHVFAQPEPHHERNPTNPPATQSAKAASPQKDTKIENRAKRQMDSAVMLAPAEAVLQTEKLALSCDSLAELERTVLSCTLCPLRIGARNGVFAEGNPQSGLMIVGEAPGKEEDEQGKPFVGASGQLLMKMLSHIGITTREQYYITNLVYWRPPGNRTPNPDELLVCHPFFKRQISLVRPRLLLLLGNVAAQTILREKSGITRLRGKFIEYDIDPAYKHINSTSDTVGVVAPSIRTLATFHPSYLLRTPAKKAATWHDLLMLRKAL